MAGGKGAGGIVEQTITLTLKVTVEAESLPTRKDLRDELSRAVMWPNKVMVGDEEITVKFLDVEE